MSPHHPISRSVVLLRVWLLMISSVMIWNAFVANGILLGGWIRPLPWLVLAGAALSWSVLPWKGVVVISMSSLLSVGMALRAIEILFYADQYSTRGRLTGASVYMTIAGTSLLIGLINLMVTSRRTAEEWVWERRST